MKKSWLFIGILFYSLFFINFVSSICTQNSIRAQGPDFDRWAWSLPVLDGQVSINDNRLLCVDGEAFVCGLWQENTVSNGTVKDSWICDRTGNEGIPRIKNCPSCKWWYKPSATCSNNPNSWSDWSVCNSSGMQTRVCGAVTNQCSGVINECTSSSEEVRSCNPCINNRTYDLAFYGPENNGLWHIADVNGKVITWANQWGYSGSLAVSGDYNGDGRDDLAVLGKCADTSCSGAGFNPALYYWYVKDVNGSLISWSNSWGFNNSQAVSGDYNGDGRDDLAIYYNGQWWILDIQKNIIIWNKTWGFQGAIPVSGDYNGDGKSDLAVYGPNSTGQWNWWIADINETVIKWGLQHGFSGAIPVSGDYNGDGKSDLAVYSDVQKKWWIIDKNGTALPGLYNFDYGPMLPSGNYVPVSGDYNGNGKSDLALYSNSYTWYIVDSDRYDIFWNSFQWGYPGAIPVSGDYNFKCISPGASPGLQTFWSSLDSPDFLIDSLDSGDTLLMRFDGQNLGGNEVINYTVQKKNSGVWNSILGFVGLSKPWSDFTKISSVSAYENITIIEEGNFSFIAKIVGQASEKRSNNLIVSNTINNSAPDARINSPLNNCNYTINTPVRFNQISIDNDDLLKITWDFGDGSAIRIFDRYNPSINISAADTTHNYTSIGPKVVKLTAQDYRTTGSKSDSDTANVAIFKSGINVVPVISSPPDLSVFGNGSVYFNANQSYVLNCSSGPMLNTNFTTCDGLLNCSYIHSPGTIPDNDLKIYLNWSFGDGKYKAGYWNSTSHINLTSFTYTYLTANEHKISLNMKFNWTG